MPFRIYNHLLKFIKSTFYTRFRKNGSVIPQVAVWVSVVVNNLRGTTLRITDFTHFFFLLVCYLWIEHTKLTIAEFNLEKTGEPLVVGCLKWVIPEKLVTPLSAVSERKKKWTDWIGFISFYLFLFIIL